MLRKSHVNLLFSQLGQSNVKLSPVESFLNKREIMEPSILIPLRPVTVIVSVLEIPLESIFNFSAFSLIHRIADFASLTDSKG